ncbi:MAG TPA: YceI family protein [Alphaproteobacteria bacterium]|nr:YceI family protein [Alphaproteobacteria bacterium]
MSVRTILFALLLVFASSSALLAQTPTAVVPAAKPPAAPPAPAAQPPMALPQPSTNLTGAPAGLYVADKGHASIIFRINHLGFSLYPGRFEDFDAKINLDPAAPEKSTVDVTVDINSVDTHNAKLDEELRSADWFNAAKFPTAKFHSTNFIKTGPDKGMLQGEFTMMGVTHPISLDVVFHGYGQHPMTKAAHLGFGATGTIKRSEWGFSKGVPMVGDEVQLIIEAEFDHAGAPAAPPPAPAGK